MAEWIGGLMTAVGRDLQALVEAGDTPLIITTMKLGSGITTEDVLDAATDLTRPELEVGISSRRAEGGVCKIASVVSSINVKTGFYAREIGIFAEHPTLGNILYMYSIDSKPDFVPAHSTTLTVSVDYWLGIVIGNAPNIKIEFDPKSLVTLEMLNTITHTLARNTEYRQGDVVVDSQLRAGQYLKCITGGTTSPMDLIIENPYLNSIYNDGTAQWMIVTMASYEGDCFKRDREGNIRVSIPKHREGDPVLFTQDENGIRVADRFFYSWQFMWTAEGSIVPRPTDYLGPDGKPDGGDDEEDDYSTPTEAEMDDLYEKLKAQAEAQANI